MKLSPVYVSLEELKEIPGRWFCVQVVVCRRSNLVLTLKHHIEPKDFDIHYTGKDNPIAVLVGSLLPSESGNVIGLCDDEYRFPRLLSSAEEFTDQELQQMTTSSGPLKGCTWKRFSLFAVWSKAYGPRIDQPDQEPERRQQPAP